MGSSNFNVPLSVQLSVHILVTGVQVECHRSHSGPTVLDPPPGKVDCTSNNHHGHQTKACSSDCMHNPGIAIGMNMIDCMLHIINVMHYGFSAISNFDQVWCHLSLSVVSYRVKAGGYTQPSSTRQGGIFPPHFKHRTEECS